MTLGYEYAHWPIDSNHNHKQADASKSRLMQAKAGWCKQKQADASKSMPVQAQKQKYFHGL